MFKLTFNAYLLILMFNNYKIINAQVHLGKDNLSELCNCIPSVSSRIGVILKNISTIDSSTFKGLNLLRDLELQINQITTIYP